jgi:hypothetical protein
MVTQTGTWGAEIITGYSLSDEAAELKALFVPSDKE